MENKKAYQEVDIREKIIELENEIKLLKKSLSEIQEKLTLESSIKRLNEILFKLVEGHQLNE